MAITIEAAQHVGAAGAGAGAGIRLRGVVKEYPLRRAAPVRALDSMDLDVAPGEFVALLGPSGCGKSTVLRLVAGLEQADAGKISVDGAAPGQLAAQHRLGVAFQDHALLPWASIEDNVGLPYQLAGRRVEEWRVGELLAMVGIAEFATARPKHLSGGMRQRASIARALVLQPDVLLLDEPFGALDAVTRRRLNVELQDIWARDKVTTLLVTHSVDEAVFLADRVVVMTGRPGRVRTVVDIDFERPRTASLLRSSPFHQLVDDLTRQLDEEDGR